jgi:pyruvate/2-oxoglutarate dehydrogenase complex dihydrolipoamide dehydrogenase (E3) component
MVYVTDVVIIGGGPGGYEAALVAAQLGAQVTVVERDGLGGAAVLTDCVPSKAAVATAEAVVRAQESASLGVRVAGRAPSDISVDLGAVNERIRGLAHAQSDDISTRLDREGVRTIHGVGTLLDASTVEVRTSAGEQQVCQADAILLATGARPRVPHGMNVDGERILTWQQIYSLTEPPDHLVVIGSGVTGAEFASAFCALGARVTLVSSRERVLPGEDPDAARLLEEVFARRGMTVMSQSRAASARSTGTGVVVELTDGRSIEGSHVLLAVGSLPNTESLGLEHAGVELDDHGFIRTDRVSRTSSKGIYAAGDCTGVMLLASVAAMQGRTAMRHALGDAVQPFDRTGVSSTVFTDPEIATVGVTQARVDAGEVAADCVVVPLARNARAKMLDITEGFVKIFCRPESRLIIGSVVVAPRASELIHSLTMAVDLRLTVDQVASSFTVYPSLSGSIAEAARQLHVPGD